MLIKDFLPDSAMTSKLPDQGRDSKNVMSNQALEFHERLEIPEST